MCSLTEVIAVTFIPRCHQLISVSETEKKYFFFLGPHVSSIICYIDSWSTQCHCLIFQFWFRLMNLVLFWHILSLTFLEFFIICLIPLLGLGPYWLCDSKICTCFTGIESENWTSLWCLYKNGFGRVLIFIQSLVCDELENAITYFWAPCRGRSAV